MMVIKLVNIRLGEYSPIFAEPRVNNCFSIIIQVIIREKREINQKISILFVSVCASILRVFTNFTSVLRVPGDS